MYGAPPVDNPPYPDPAPVTPATTALPAYEPEPFIDPADPLGAPTTPPPSTPPNYSQGPL
jgi:hypothetical protein